MDADRRRLGLRCAAWAVALTAVVVGGAWGLRQLERRVLARSAASGPELGVRLVGRPDWMPRATMQRIARDLVGDDADYYDPALVARVHRRAQGEPWIRTVRRVSKYRSGSSGLAVVEIKADYRRPIACAGCNGRYHVVDADGVRLPQWEAPRFVAEPPAGDAAGGRGFFADLSQVPAGWDARRLHYVVVELHDEYDPSPPAVGEPWDSAALAAGLQLVRRVLDEPYAGEVTKVDVRNYQCRVICNEPELLMFAQTGRGRPTRILFGRFPEGRGDFVVPPERKFTYLDGYYADHGRLAGLARGLDLRHDHLLVIPY
jgi:hypothetical protein